MAARASPLDASEGMLHVASEEGEPMRKDTVQDTDAQACSKMRSLCACALSR